MKRIGLILLISFSLIPALAKEQKISYRICADGTKGKNMAVADQMPRDVFLECGFPLDYMSRCRAQSMSGSSYGYFEVRLEPRCPKGTSVYFCNFTFNTQGKCFYSATGEDCPFDKQGVSYDKKLKLCRFSSGKGDRLDSDSPPPGRLQSDPGDQAR